MTKDRIDKFIKSDVNSNLTLAVYTADRWEHVCPIVRLTGPAAQAGVNLIRGNEWENGNLQVFPERVSQADVVVIQRDFPGHEQAYQKVISQAHVSGKPVVYELDDLLPELPDQHPDVVHYITTRSAILRAIVEADAVVGSSPALCDYLRSFNPNAWLLPNYLNDQLWGLAPVKPNLASNSPVRIGYMGGHSHSYDLETIMPALLHLLHRYGGKISLKFMGAMPPPAIRDLHNVAWVDVGLVDYGQFITFFKQQDCDIFIAPLQDNLFNRCKSHIKFLEYSALAVPGVYSRIAPYESVVRHGENGFLASSNEEWERYLSQLIEDPALRFRTGSNAQDSVRASWLLSDHVDEWMKTYQRFSKPMEKVYNPEITSNISQKMHTWQADLEKRVAQQGETLEKQAREIKQLNQQLISYQTQLAEKDQAYQYVRDLYMEIMNSTSWKLIQKMIRLRLKLVPLGSKSERLLKMFLRAPQILRREGVRPFLRVASTIVKGQGSLLQTPATPQIREEPKASLVDGAFCSDPAISVIIIEDSGPDSGEPIPMHPESETRTSDEDPNHQVRIKDFSHLETVRSWIEAQTCPYVDAVIWDKTSGSACILDDPTYQWEAPDVQSLCGGLRSRYLCIASQDLLQQESTYLELNLIALETERLAFTVNLKGHATWAIRQLEQGLLPGDETTPLMRQVVAKDCLRDGFALDFSPKMGADKNQPEIVGKLLVHTTNDHDIESLLPFRSRLPEVDHHLNRHEILVRSDADLPWKTTAHILHPLDTVIPATPEPGDLPTVIMVMPFLAVGGAEQIALKVMHSLKDQIRFAVVSFEELDPELGTTADAFRQVTPYVYTIPDFMNGILNMSFMNYLIERLNPQTLYIANGTMWIYDALEAIKAQHPHLRIVDQVYDYVVGWINRYDMATVLYQDGHIGVNSKICQAYIDKGAKPDQVYLIENGIEPGELDPAAYSQDKIFALKKEFGLPLDKKIVTFASRVHPQKRPMDFVELARRLSTDPSMVFLMVGDGPLAAQVSEQVARIGLKNFYRRPFYRPISDVFAISEVLVLPSDFEGMPMIIIEALAMGTPVVVTDVGNNREVVEYTRGGIVIPRIGDVTALMDGVLKMIKEPPDPDKLRQATLARFDIAVVSQKYRRALLGE
jgi:glycosyltransferase involved in cell wall biosynthesis